jgi:hypothetical protein
MDPSEYTAALRLLQDLCSSSGEIPSLYRLENVTFDRGDVIGRGAEASVYRGKFGGQEVAVREIVMPRSSWRLPAGQKIIRVITIHHVDDISVHFYNVLSLYIER